MKISLIAGTLLTLFALVVRLFVFLQDFRGDEKAGGYYIFNHWFDLMWEITIPSLSAGIIFLGYGFYLRKKSITRSSQNVLDDETDPWDKIFRKEFSRDTITRSDLLQIMKLDLEDEKLPDHSPLSACLNLEWLNLSSTGLKDLTPLKDLKRLKALYAEFSYVTDLSPLKNLVLLEELDLSAPLDALTSLTGLENCEKLTKLYVPDHAISDLSPIMRLSCLKILSIVRTNVPEEQVVEFQKRNPACEVFYKVG